MPIRTRIKTPESVREKIMDALANVIASDKEKFQVYNSEDIKETIGYEVDPMYVYYLDKSFDILAEDLTQ